MVHVVELAACMAPACNLDQRRLTVGRGWPVEPFEPGNMLCTTYYRICCLGIYVVPAPTGGEERTPNDC
jgi:hypothetical protein